MILIERVIYFFIFLLNKYIGINFTENLLNKYENKLINKYVKREYKKTLRIHTIKYGKLKNKRFMKL